jgi:hypothetical protein
MSSSNLCEHSSESDLIAYYANPQVNHVLGGTPSGNKGVRISSLAVIKFGIGVTRDEADNQAKAYELVNHEIIRMPQVYRFFTDVRGRGYLVMEFMDGEVIEPPETLAEFAKIARVLGYLATFRGDVPGTLGGGPSCGLLFPDTDVVRFGSMEDIEK